MLLLMLLSLLMLPKENGKQTNSASWSPRCNPLESLFEQIGTLLAKPIYERI
jgi:hypothetical protein